MVELYHEDWITEIHADLALVQQGATLYTIQLGLNLIWTPLFFRLKMPVAAAVDAAALTLTTGYLTYVWSQFDDVAALCMVPYVAWSAFATYLTVCTAGRDL